MKQPALARVAGWRLTRNRTEVSSGLGDFAGLDASRADFHPARATLRLLHADGLQIWIEATRRAIVRVRDIVAELWSFAADFATFGHFSTSRDTQGFFIVFPASYGR